MQPFKITCVTCQSRLAVRSAALVGQILACPRCGSMVQVTAPAGHGGAAAANIAASAPSGVLEHLPAEHASGDQSLATNSFDEAVDVGAPVPAAAALPQHVTRPAATGLSTTKLLAFGAGSAVIGSALVAAALSLLRAEPAANLPTSAPAASAPVVTAPTTMTQAPPADAAGVAGDGALPVGQERPEPQAAAATPDALQAGELFAPAPAPVAPPTAAAADALASAPPAAPIAPSAAEVDDLPAPESDAAPRLRIDPLELDPEGLDLTTLMDAGRADRAPDALALNDLAAESAAPVASEATDEAARQAAADGGRGNAGRPAAEAEAIEPPAAAEVLLARRIAGVTIKEMPLCRFLDFATALSAVPVSVSPTELRLAAVSAATPVSVDVQDATIEQVLAAGLKPLRLVPVVEGEQIVLRRAGEDRRRELAYPVDDLIDAEMSAAELAAWVERFVAPESWQGAGGAGRVTVDGNSLRVEQTERVGYETILFLEQYRTARGLAPRSKYPAALLQSRSAKAELAARLAAPATFTFSRPTAVRELFRWWQEESDVAVLVDWPALAALRVGPQTRVTASAAAQPWGGALTAALAPLGLDWRAVDARTIEITTEERVNGEPVLDMYRLIPVRDRTAQQNAALQEQIAKLADAAAQDATHDVLVVRQPAGVQRRLAGWLAAEGLVAPTGTAARFDAAAKPAAVSE